MNGLIVLKPRMTAAEIAEIAKCNKETVLRAYRRGDLKGGAKVGKSITFPSVAVAKWLKKKGIENLALSLEEVA